MKVLDQMNRMVEVPQRPMRIVSLVPSQTEFLYDLGLDEEVVGITKFCIHPKEWFRSKSRVGGTKNVSLEKVRALKPDLIIGNKEENDRDNIEALAEEFPVWMSDIFDLDDAYAMMKSIGELVGKQARSEELVSCIQDRFAQINPVQDQRKTAYFIWKDPWLMAGKETFIDDMLTQCGFKNFQKESRYPELNTKVDNSVSLVLLSSEPYPFKEKHVQEVGEWFPNAEVRLVDGEMFSWYGSRLLQAPDYFQSLIDSI